MQRALSFDQTPALSVPLRFFLTAPAFALAAAGVLAWQGEAALVSRWAPATLALTHLLTLGFLAMVMIGALLQMLPVVAGIAVPRTRLTAGGVWLALCAGSVLLPVAFLDSAPVLFRGAAVALGAAFSGLLAGVGAGLLRQRPPAAAAASVNGMRLALLSLAVTAGLGVALATVFGWGTALPVVVLTNLHAGWGLLGWIGLLLVGVAFQVIPMFQATPTYPAWFSRHAPLLLALLLAAWSLAVLLRPDWQHAAALPVAAGMGGFGLLTLRLLQQRKRPRPDATTLYWRLAMACLLAAAVVFALPVATETRPLLLGVLFLAGTALSAVCGMLCKIVPFLLWYHLQQASGIDRKTMPNIKTLLPDRAAEQQFWLHCAAVALLLAAALAPNLFARPAAAAFACAMARLWFNLLHAAWMYRRCSASAGGSALVGA